VHNATCAPTKSVTFFPSIKRTWSEDGVTVLGIAMTGGNNRSCSFIIAPITPPSNLLIFQSQSQVSGSVSPKIDYTCFALGAEILDCKAAQLMRSRRRWQLSCD
jgi:hypothetical protein